MTPEPAIPVAIEQTVAVNHGQVGAVGAVLGARNDREGTGAAKWDDPQFWNVEASAEDRCQYLAIGNAINFRFWDQVEGQFVPATGVIDGQRFRGSMYMWRRLRQAVGKGQLLLDAGFLAELDEATFSRAFTDDHGRLPLKPGMADRILNLRDLGARLSAKWQGQFANMIEASHGSLQRFATLSAEFRAFDDTVQKLTMVNAIMLTGSQLAAFDREPLPGVDYHLVKQALRQGLVIPSDDLRAKLTNHKLLEENESLALRSAVLEAVIQVARRAGISTAAIDNLYWMNRRVCGEEKWLCSSCPFEAGCIKRTEYGLPLELTRYY